MSQIDNTITKLNLLIKVVPDKIKCISEEEINFKKSPAKWSKKEIIGHLCDSAINNLSRFIKAQYEPKPFAVARYDQDEWVKAAHYNDLPANDVINLWESANKNIINVIRFYTPEMLQYECFLDGEAFSIYTKEDKPEYLGKNGNRTMQWLIEDYAAHMEYHLKQIGGINIEL